MSMTTIPVQSKSSAWAAHFRDLMDLVKPRISAMVLVAVALSHFVASLGSPDFVMLFHVLLGTTLIAASSGAFNQWLEADVDARMDRTSNRPLPAGRMSVSEVVAFGVMTLIAGTCYLVLTVGWHPALWAIATWLVYVCVYTPMKSRSHWNTVVGAVSGAVPILIGWSAVGSPMDWSVAGMLWLLFLWQFPHFIAIAWIYRKQYDRAGLQMITTTDPSGRKAGLFSFWGAIVVLLVSLMPLLTKPSWVYAVLAVTLGIYQITAAWRFQQNQTDQTARQLLKVSVVYLPLVLGLIAVQTVL